MFIRHVPNKTKLCQLQFFTVCFNCSNTILVRLNPSLVICQGKMSIEIIVLNFYFTSWCLQLVLQKEVKTNIMEYEALLNMYPFTEISKIMTKNFTSFRQN